MSEEQPFVAVVVARFQADALHPGHHELFDYVLKDKPNTIIVVLGKSMLGLPTKHNPLDVDSRIKMIKSQYPSFVVTYLEDIPGRDEEWSINLDRLVGPIAGNRKIVMYGSRDSFLDHYKGVHQTKSFNQKTYISASEIRSKVIGKEIGDERAWRAGVIWATQQQFDHAYPTVDVALFEDWDHEQIWLGKKSLYDGYIFIGGFVDPIDTSLEAAAKREVLEETGIFCEDNLQYVCSARMNDMRYMSESDKVLTTFFIGYRSSSLLSRLEAKDDLQSLHLVKFEELTDEMFAPVHAPLFNTLRDFIKQ